MTAAELLTFVNQTLYFGLFVVVAYEAVRRPRRSALRVALLFGTVGVVVAASWTFRALGIEQPPAVSVVVAAVIMAMPYLLLRVVDDVAEVHPFAMRATEVGLVLSIAGLVLTAGPTRPVPLTLALVAYFLVVEIYAAVVVMRRSRRANGVTRRRYHAIAAGSLLFGALILVAGLNAAFPGLSPLWSILSPTLGFASGVAYYLGFTPPRWLRRAWQEPELRAFLVRAAQLPRLPDTESVVRELEEGAAAAHGAPGAAIGLWDQDHSVLRYDTPRGSGTVRPGEMLTGRALAEQRVLFSDNAPHDYPAFAEIYRRMGIRAVLAAPITAGEKRLGVLTVYAPRAPIFVEDDLVLARLLADQAAVILESRALLDEATRVRAQAEATRLKEDFLSAAAHDLKTPLTSLIGQAQLLRRRAARGGVTQEVLIRDADLIVRESTRLRDLVLELLDAGRVERGGLTGPREPIDLTELARETCERHGSERHTCEVEADGPLVTLGDRVRVSQLFQNLVENGVKYSPDGGPIVIRVSRVDDVARISVQDRGIGVPADDLPRLFERFHRGGNVDDRRFAGMGLGLYICRGIVEEHGGRIWAESQVGRGSTFWVELPVRDAVAVAAG